MESTAAQPEPHPSAFGAASAEAVPAPLRIPWRRPLALIAIVAWLVPGLGQVLMGRLRKGLVMGVAICGLYAGGLALAGFACVDPDAYRLEFVAHVFAGVPTWLTLHFGEQVAAPEFHAHFDVGRLYVAVASLLNVVAISDALGDAMTHNAAVRDIRRHLKWPPEVSP